MKTLDGVTYTPATEAQTYKGTKQFYPVVMMYGVSIGGQVFYLNEPQPTRSRARTIARNYIKNI